MRTGALGLAVLALVACGGPTSQVGTIGWEKGQAQLVVSGDDQFTLELQNRGAAPVTFKGGPGWPTKEIAAGGIQRLSSSGSQIFTLENAASEKALVEYSFYSEGDTHIDARIP